MLRPQLMDRGSAVSGQRMCSTRRPERMSSSRLPCGAGEASPRTVRFPNRRALPPGTPAPGRGRPMGVRCQVMLLSGSQRKQRSPGPGQVPLWAMRLPAQHVPDWPPLPSCGLSPTRLGAPSLLSRPLLICGDKPPPRLSSTHPSLPEPPGEGTQQMRT